MSETVSLSSFPSPLQWLTAPVAWSGGEDSPLSITAGERTDLFVDPRGAPPMLNAPCLLGAVSGDFQFSARVAVEFAATFDAGALLAWVDDRHWAKLCLEFSPRRQPMVVSVVTRGISDDANGFIAPENQVWLRICRLGASFAFHASTDGRWWELIRHFALEAGEAVHLGLIAQSPTGACCTARFAEVRLSSAPLLELRNGD